MTGLPDPIDGLQFAGLRHYSQATQMAKTLKSPEKTMQFNALNRLTLQLLLTAAFAAGVLLVPFQAFAKGEESVQGVMEQFRIVRLADGNESRVAAQNVKPGETLEYSVRYTNKVPYQ